MSIRALVVDDSSTMRTIVVNSLQAVGVTDVVEAEDGNRALTLFHQDEFDLIAIDWFMPGKSGLDVIKSIRATGSQVPILMVTAEAMGQQVAAAIEAGASDYLIKPFKIETLREKLAKICGPLDAKLEAGSPPGDGTRL